MKRLLESVVDSDVRTGQLKKLAKLGQALAVVAQDQVMDQSPGLGVKGSSLAALVVIRRVVVDREQRAQRKQFLFPQRLEVIRNQLAEMDLSIFFDIKTAVVLRQTFVEPKRHVARRVIDQQVHVFVIDHTERILTRFGRERDVVYVLAFLKIAGIVSGIERLV